MQRSRHWRCRRRSGKIRGNGSSASTFSPTWKSEQRFPLTGPLEQPKEKDSRWCFFLTASSLKSRLLMVCQAVEMRCRDVPCIRMSRWARRSSSWSYTDFGTMLQHSSCGGTTKRTPGIHVLFTDQSSEWSRTGRGRCRGPVWTGTRSGQTRNRSARCAP
jgi:hypothetical protein